jgi:hypothetical protein
VAREGLIDKVTFEQGSEENKGEFGELKLKVFHAEEQWVLKTLEKGENTENTRLLV